MPEEPKVPAPVPTAERRDAVVQKLSHAFASGLIEMEDFEARTEIAVRARTVEELEATLAGLEPKRPVVASRNPGEFAIDQPRRHASRFTLIAMGGVDRKGRWMPARRHVGVAVMGGAFLDFREAVLQPGTTHVHLFTMWGGIEVAVPPGLDVDVSGGALMGGLERVSQESGSTDPRRPRLHVHAFALMGGIEVRVLQPGEKWDDEKQA